MKYWQYIITLPLHILLFMVTIKYMDKIYGDLKIKRALLYTTAAIFLLFTYIGKQIQLTNIDLGQGVIFAVILSVFYSANVRTKIIFSSLAVVLAIFSQTIVLYFSILILQEGLEVIVSLSPQYFVATTFMYILYSMLCFFVTKFQKNKKNIFPPKILTILLSIPLISVIGIVVLFNDITNIKNLSNSHTIFNIVILLLILYINFSVLYLFDLLVGLFSETIDRRILETQIMLQNKYYEKLESNQETIKCMRHDMKNQLKTIHYNITNGNINIVNSIIENMVIDITNTEKIIDSGNPPIDSILSIKIDEASKKDIQIETDIIIPQNLNLTFEESVALFGNVLDNAIEACEKLPEKEKVIFFEMRYINGALYIESSNYLKDTLTYNAYNENVFKTSKKDKSNHGFGLKNIKLIADKYNGMVKITTDHSIFLIKIVLYNL